VKFIKAETPTNRPRVPLPASEAASRAHPVAGAPNAARVKRDGPQEKLKPEAAPSQMDDFKNDPLIRKALEIFKGQIVEVRS